MGKHNLTSVEKTIDSFQDLYLSQREDLRCHARKVMSILDRERVKSGIKTSREWGIRAGLSGSAVSQYINGHRIPTIQQVRMLYGVILSAKNP